MGILTDFISRWRRPTNNGLQKAVQDNLLKYSHMIPHEVLQTLDTTENGLLGLEARERLKEYGRNEISYEKPPTWYRLLYFSYINPFNILLTLLGIISYFLGDADGTVIISIMVGVSVGIRFIQELRSNIAAEKLKEMVSTKATVIRQGEIKSPPVKFELPIQNIVPGDVIFLS